MGRVCHSKHALYLFLIIAVTVSFTEPEYSLNEDIGTLTVCLVESALLEREVVVAVGSQPETAQSKL